jgi:hypothetical protein
MEKNLKRYAKVFGHKQVIDDGLLYPTQKYEEKVSLVLYITRSQICFARSLHLVLPISSQKY